MLQRPGQDASVTARAPPAPSRGRALVPPAPGLSGAQQPGWVTLWLHRLSRVGRETGRPSQAFVTRHMPRRPPRGVSFVTCHRLALLHVLLPLGKRPGGAAFGQPRARRSLKNWDSVTEFHGSSAPAAAAANLQATTGGRPTLMVRTSHRPASQDPGTILPPARTPAGLPAGGGTPRILRRPRPVRSLPCTLFQPLLLQTSRQALSV